MRVLPVKRISRDSEDSSALERQTYELEEALALGGHTVAGWVEDSCVSGAVNLDQRPSLSKWLAEPLVHEWDALMVTTQDRISRDDLHWWKFVGWTLEHGKKLIILDDPGFDISTSRGRMLAGVKAGFASDYRETVQKKKLNQTAHYRKMRWWPGGTWPFGYRTTPIVVDGKQRWKLIRDEYTSKLVREAYKRLVEENDSMGGIAKDWNKRRILTTLDYQRHRNAKEGRSGAKTEVKGTKWSTTSVKAVLTKKSLMGYAMHKGDVITENGLPVVWADPILTRDEFDKLQNVIEEHGRHRKGITATKTPLVGVIYCKCTKKLYSNVAHKSYATYFYYICQSRNDETPCEYVTSWPRELLQSYLEDIFISELGELEVIKKRYIPGKDNTSEIKELKDAIGNLTQAIAASKSSAAVASLSEALEKHSENLEALEKEPVVPARWEEVRTGITYREQWEQDEDWHRRTKLLHDIGIRMYCGGIAQAPELHYFIPDELEKRARDASSNLPELKFLEEWQKYTKETAAKHAQERRVIIETRKKRAKG